MTSVLSGCLLEPATGFTGSSTIMASLLGLVCAFAASDNQLSNVYCLNVPCDGTVVDSTASAERGRGCECSNYRVEIGTVGIKNLEDLANRNSSVTV